MSERIDYGTMTVTLNAMLWGQIVLAAQESDDWRLRALIEQAVHEPVGSAEEPKP